MTQQEDLEQLALGRLTRVLGTATARRAFDETLRSAGLEAIRSADDLHRFAAMLLQRGGFEAAVGGMLSVAAVMRGASPTGDR